jgi:PPOX class probable F420-dependent enzyme
LDERETVLVQNARVARFATADSSGAPHLIPICFVYDGVAFYSVLDQKPKRTSVTRLRRVRNILENPKVALVVDSYEEDWSRLWYILVTGTATLLEPGTEQSEAVAMLREKYAQYRDMDLEYAPVIK